MQDQLHPTEQSMTASFRKPPDCADLSEVRQEIDRIDAALVSLIGERLGYVERAWQIKLDAGQEAKLRLVGQVAAKVWPNG